MSQFCTNTVHVRTNWLQINSTVMNLMVIQHVLHYLLSIYCNNESSLILSTSAMYISYIVCVSSTETL